MSDQESIYVRAKKWDTFSTFITLVRWARAYQCPGLELHQTIKDNYKYIPSEELGEGGGWAYLVKCKLNKLKFCFKDIESVTNHTTPPINNLPDLQYLYQVWVYVTEQEKNYRKKIEIYKDCAQLKDLDEEDFLDNVEGLMEVYELYVAAEQLIKVGSKRGYMLLGYH